MELCMSIAFEYFLRVVNLQIALRVNQALRV
jgi:hypothetical protein